MIDYFINNYPEILQKTSEHLSIAMTSLLLGIIFAIPVGIAITRNEKVAKIVMGIASVLQTIPAFSLFSFMTIFGVGRKPAIIALFLYSLLPILRNTYLGITNVDENIVDAARGMGMTDRQILFGVQIPIAIPVIMTGVRLSAVYVIAWTSLASYIGAGGLGDYIFVGLNNYRLEMIFWGTVPVSIMALIADFLLSLVEKKFTPAYLLGGES